MFQFYVFLWFYGPYITVLWAYSKMGAQMCAQRTISGVGDQSLRVCLTHYCLSSPNNVLLDLLILLISRANLILYQIPEWLPYVFSLRKPSSDWVPSQLCEGFCLCGPCIFWGQLMTGGYLWCCACYFFFYFLKLQSKDSSGFLSISSAASILYSRHFWKELKNKTINARRMTDR